MVNRWYGSRVQGRAGTDETIPVLLAYGAQGYWQRWRADRRYALVMHAGEHFEPIVDTRLVLDGADGAWTRGVLGANPKYVRSITRCRRRCLPRLRAAAWRNV